MKDLSIRIDGNHMGLYGQEDENNKISLDNAPLKEIHDTINAIYKFILDTSEDMKECTLKFEEGSFVTNVELPEKSVEFINHALTEDEFSIDDPYYNLLSSLQRISRNSPSNLRIDFGFDKTYYHYFTNESVIDIRLKEQTWLKSELTVYGKITNLGGKKPNFHLSTEDYGEIIVNIDLFWAQKLTVYESYNFNLLVDQSFEDPTQIKNARFVSMDEAVKPISLSEYVKREENNWKDVVDPNGWVRSMRGGMNDDN